MDQGALLSNRALGVSHVLDNVSAAAITNTNGAVIVSGPFTSERGGRLLVMASGSIWADATGGIGLKSVLLQIDGVTVATRNWFINTTAEHQAFAAMLTVETGIAAGAHTIRWITGAANFNTDASDRYDLVVLELPFA